MSDESKPALLNVKDLAGISTPLVKLIETVRAGGGRVSDGVSRLANAYFLASRDAKNDANRIRLIEEAKTETLLARAKAMTALAGGQRQELKTLDINSEGVSAQLMGVPAGLQALHERSVSYAAYRNIWQQLNRDAVLENAAAELEQDDKVNSDPVNPDVAARILGIVQDVSDEEMQLLWGKILAGEIKKPGSYSLRTLETLRNLSQSDAAAFVELGNYVMEVFLNERTDLILYVGITSNTLYNFLSYNKIRLLIECGLVGGVVDNIYDLSFTVDAGPRALHRLVARVGDQVLVCYQSGDAPLKVSFQNLTLTQAGKELYALTQKSANISYLAAVAKELTGYGFTVKRTAFNGWTKQGVDFAQPMFDLS